VRHLRILDDKPPGFQITDNAQTAQRRLAPRFVLRSSARSGLTQCKAFVRIGMLQRAVETIRPVRDDVSKHERRNPSEIGIVDVVLVDFAMISSMGADEIEQLHLVVSHEPIP
jgi:hypothetical protein